MDDANLNEYLLAYVLTCKINLYVTYGTLKKMHVLGQKHSYTRTDGTFFSGFASTWGPKGDMEAHWEIFWVNMDIGPTGQEAHWVQTEK